MPFEAFLKLDGIPGESADAKHKNEIEVLSFGFGVTRAGTPASGGTGAGAGKPQFHDFFFTANTQVATPRLLAAAAAGTHLKSAVLSVRRGGGAKQEFLKWTLSDVTVTSLQSGGARADAAPVDSVALNFRKVEVEYRPVSPKGALGSPVTAGWDLAKNAKL